MAIHIREIRRGSFDARAIQSKTATAHERLQMKFGAFARRQMKGLVRYRKKSAAPGYPPSAHRSEGFTREKKGKRQNQSPLRELIYFARDYRTGTMVVGPAIFGAAEGGQVPRALEKGGETTRRVPIERPARTGRRASRQQARAFKRLVKEGRITVPPREYRVETHRVHPHPFVKPAGDQVATGDQFRGLLKGMVR